MHESVASIGANGDWISRYFEGVCAEILSTGEIELASQGHLSSATEALLYELRSNYNKVLDFEFGQAQQVRREMGVEVDDWDIAEGNVALFARFKVVLGELSQAPSSRRIQGRDRRVFKVGENGKGFRGR